MPCPFTLVMMAVTPLVLLLIMKRGMYYGVPLPAEFKDWKLKKRK